MLTIIWRQIQVGTTVTLTFGLTLLNISAQRIHWFLRLFVRKLLLLQTLNRFGEAYSTDTLDQSISGSTFQPTRQVLVSRLVENVNINDGLFFLDIRDQTIRELFRSYPTFSRRKRDPDSYDKSINKICLNITHSYDEKLQVRYYHFKLMSKKINVGRLAQQNQDEGCQLLLVTTKHFVPVPYESENLVIKSITKTLSRGFRFYKLTIQFCDQFSNRAGESIVFDPIINVQLYDWWDSRFDKILNHKC